jgi:hypothetical protein
LEFTPALRVQFVKCVNNLIGSKWACKYLSKEENYYDYDGNEAEDAFFVRPVTFLNIIYLLKIDGR